MKKYFYIFITTIIFLTSCTNNVKQDPKLELLNAYSSILSEETTFNAKIEQAIKNSDFNSLRAESDSSLARSQRELNKIQLIEFNDPQYKNSIQEAAKAMIDIIETGKKLGELTTASTEQEYNDLITLYNKEVEELPSKIEVVNKLK